MSTRKTAKDTKRKVSTVKHTRSNRKALEHHKPEGPPAAAVEQRLTELIHPATYEQMAYCRHLGLRERLLTLPVMVALTLSMIWRQIGSVSELVRVLEREGMLWTGEIRVSQQALSQRLLTFPAELFKRVLDEVLVQMHARWRERWRDDARGDVRPLPDEVAWARQCFKRVLIFDGSTLDSVLRKLKAIRDTPKHPTKPLLGGRMGCLIDLASRLPVEIWREESAQAHDQAFLPRLKQVVAAYDLLIFDAGFVSFEWYDSLTALRASFITRVTERTRVHAVLETLVSSPNVHDRVVRLGCGKTLCQQPMRLIEVLYRGTWYRYVTNVVHPEILSTDQVVALYRRRWRIEDVFLTVKQLLGLAYLWVGSDNGICLQVWATWLLFCVLTDLVDAIAERLSVSADRISIEMVFRGLYHFTQAFHRGRASDPIAYLADPANRNLGVLKRSRPKQNPKPKPDPYAIDDLIRALDSRPNPLTCD